MDILRLMGQRGLLGPDAPVRHPAKRRQIKTVMQELIYRAGRLIEHGRQLILGLGANDRAAKAFARLNGELFAASSYSASACQRTNQLTDPENSASRWLRRGAGRKIAITIGTKRLKYATRCLGQADFATIGAELGNFQCVGHGKLARAGIEVTDSGQAEALDGSRCSSEDR